MACAQPWVHDAQVNEAMFGSRIHLNTLQKSLCQSHQTSKASGLCAAFASRAHRGGIACFQKAKTRPDFQVQICQKAHNAHSNKITNREREPWLIATWRSLSHLTAKQVISVYRQRMQIEEGFRDLKCERYGLGFSNSLTKTAKRLEILLLLGALALVILWMTGVTAIKQKHQYRYQSNTLRSHSVLSSIFMGMRIMRHDSRKYSNNQLLCSPVACERI